MVKLVMKTKAFTLIELLVVVAIIGILAAVGVTTFGGFQDKAKIAAAKANQKSITKYLAAEAMRCQLDSSETILYGQYSCTTLYSVIAGGGNPGGAVSNAIVAGLNGKFKIYSVSGFRRNSLVLKLQGEARHAEGSWSSWQEAEVLA